VQRRLGCHRKLIGALACAFDSADACEEMRAIGWNLEGATPERLAFTRASRCVPAEHLYPPKK